MRIPLLKEIALELLSEAGTISREVFFTGYATSYKNARRIMLHGASRTINNAQIRESFNNMISRLAREGLARAEKRGTAWKLTKRGTAWLRGRSWLPRLVPTGEKDAQTIVIFDIPEKERAKRQWLRTNLVLLGFTMLQQSVWIGEQKLPGKFMEQISILGLSKCVHIFAIAKHGTLASRSRG